MNDAQNAIEYISGVRGQHTALDDLLAELYPEGRPELMLETRGTAGRGQLRLHRVYRFPDGSFAKLSYSTPLGPDREAVEPQCCGTVVYAVVRQSVDYLTVDQRHALDELALLGLPVESSTREWTIAYWRDGEEVTRDIIWTGDQGEEVARFNHAKLSRPAALDASSYDAITLQARTVYHGPWQTITNPPSHTTPPATQAGDTTTTVPPQTRGQK